MTSRRVAVYSYEEKVLNEVARHCPSFFFTPFLSTCSSRGFHFTIVLDLSPSFFVCSNYSLVLHELSVKLKKLLRCMLQDDSEKYLSVMLNFSHPFVRSQTLFQNFYMGNEEDAEIVSQKVDSHVNKILSELSMQSPCCVAEASAILSLRYGILLSLMAPADLTRNVIIFSDMTFLLPLDQTEELQRLLFLYEISCFFVNCQTSEDAFANFGFLPDEQEAVVLSFNSNGSVIRNMEDSVSLASKLFGKEVLSKEANFDSFFKNDPFRLKKSSAIGGIVCEKYTSMKVTKLKLSSYMRTKIREGFKLYDIQKNSEETSICFRLSLRADCFIECDVKISYEWQAHEPFVVDVFLEGPYEFVHNIFVKDGKCDHVNCRINTSRSGSFFYVQAFEKASKLFFAIINQSTETKFAEIKNFAEKMRTHSLPDPVKEGTPLFKQQYDNSGNWINVPNFMEDVDILTHISFWKFVYSLDLNTWQKWFRVQRFCFLMKPDYLSENLFKMEKSGEKTTSRYALKQLHEALKEWSTIVISETDMYVKYLYAETESKENSEIENFVLAKVNLDIQSVFTHCFVLFLAFPFSVPVETEERACSEVSDIILQLKVPKSKNDQENEKPTVTEFTKCLDKVTIRYDSCPDNFDFVLPVGLEKAVKKYPNSETANRVKLNVYNSLSSFYKHRRWIWYVPNARNSPVAQDGASAVVTACEKLLFSLMDKRSSEGFQIVYAREGTVVLALELPILLNRHRKPAKSLVQYACFRPRFAKRDKFITLVTEAWVEPQVGEIDISNIQTGRSACDCDELFNAFGLIDSDIINSHLNYTFCLELIEEKVTVDDLANSHVPMPKDSLFVSPNITRVPFSFNPLQMLHFSIQCKVYLKSLPFLRTVHPAREDYTFNGNSNLLDFMHKCFSKASNFELDLNEKVNQSFLQHLKKRQSKSEHDYSFHPNMKYSDGEKEEQSLCPSWVLYILNPSTKNCPQLALIFVPKKFCDVLKVFEPKPCGSAEEPLLEVAIPVFVYEFCLPQVVNMLFRHKDMKVPDSFTHNPSNTSSYSPLLRDVLEVVNNTYQQSFVRVFYALLLAHANEPPSRILLQEEDVRKVLDNLEREENQKPNFYLTNLLLLNCAHLGTSMDYTNCISVDSTRPDIVSFESNQISSSILNRDRKCERFPGDHEMIQNKFWEIVNKHFAQIEGTNYFFFKREFKRDELNSPRNDHDLVRFADPALTTGGESTADDDLPSLSSDNPRLSSPAFDMVDEILNLVGMDPLFVKFDCTVEMNGQTFCEVPMSQHLFLCIREILLQNYQNVCELEGKLFSKENFLEGLKVDENLQSLRVGVNAKFLYLDALSTLEEYPFTLSFSEGSRGDEFAPTEAGYSYPSEFHRPGTYDLEDDYSYLNIDFNRKEFIDQIVWLISDVVCSVLQGAHDLNSCHVHENIMQHVERHYGGSREYSVSDNSEVEEKSLLFVDESPDTFPLLLSELKKWQYEGFSLKDIDEKGNFFHLENKKNIPYKCPFEQFLGFPYAESFGKHPVSKSYDQLNMMLSSERNCPWEENLARKSYSMTDLNLPKEPFVSEVPSIVVPCEFLHHTPSAPIESPAQQVISPLEVAADPYHSNRLPSSSNSETRFKNKYRHKSGVSTVSYPATSDYDADIESDISEGIPSPATHVHPVWMALKLGQKKCFLYLHESLGSKNCFPLEQRSVFSHFSEYFDRCVRRVNQIKLLQHFYATEFASPLLMEVDNSVGDKSKGLETNSSVDLSEKPDYSEISHLLGEFGLGHFKCNRILRHSILVHPRLHPEKQNKDNQLVSSAVLKVIQKSKMKEARCPKKFLLYRNELDHVFYVDYYADLMKYSATPKDPNWLKDDQMSLSSSYAKVSYQVFVDIYGVEEPDDYLRVTLKNKLEESLREKTLNQIWGYLSSGQLKLHESDVDFLQPRSSVPRKLLFELPKDFAPYLYPVFYYVKKNLLYYFSEPKYWSSEDHSTHFRGPNGELCSETNVLLYVDERSNRGFAGKQRGRQNFAAMGSSNGSIACITYNVLASKKRENELQVYDSTISEKASLVELLTSLPRCQLIDSKEKKPDFDYVVFHVWESGKVDIEKISNQIKTSIDQALCDLVGQVHLLNNSPIKQFHPSEGGTLAPQMFDSSYILQLFDWLLKCSLHTSSLCLVKESFEVAYRHRVQGLIESIGNEMLRKSGEFFHFKLTSDGKYLVKLRNLSKASNPNESSLDIISTNWEQSEWQKWKSSQHDCYYFICCNFGDWDSRKRHVSANMTSLDSSVSLHTASQQMNVNLPQSVLTQGELAPRKISLTIGKVVSKIVTVITYNFNQQDARNFFSTLSDAIKVINCSSRIVNCIVRQKMGLFNHNCFQYSEMQNSFLQESKNAGCSFKAIHNVDEALQNLPEVDKMAKVSKNERGKVVSDYLRQLQFAVTEEKRKGDLQKKLEDFEKTLESKNPFKFTQSDLSLFVSRSRLYHYVTTPIFLAPSWQKLTVLNSDAEITQDTMIPTDWYNTRKKEIIESFMSRFDKGHVVLQPDNNSRRSGVQNEETTFTNYLIKIINPGGVLIVKVGFYIKQYDCYFCVQLNSFLFKKSNTANVFPLYDDYYQKLDYFTDNLHVHSFAYDYQLDLLWKYVENKSNMTESENDDNYPLEIDHRHVLTFLKDFLTNHGKATPAVATRRLASSLLKKELAAEIDPILFYQYLVSHKGRYSLRAFKVPGLRGKLGIENTTLLSKKYPFSLMTEEAKSLRISDIKCLILNAHENVLNDSKVIAESSSNLQETKSLEVRYTILVTCTYNPHWDKLNKFLKESEKERWAEEEQKIYDVLEAIKERLMKECRSEISTVMSHVETHFLRDNLLSRLVNNCTQRNLSLGYADSKKKASTHSLSISNEEIGDLLSYLTPVTLFEYIQGASFIANAIQSQTGDMSFDQIERLCVNVLTNADKFAVFLGSHFMTQSFKIDREIDRVHDCVLVLGEYSQAASVGEESTVPEMVLLISKNSEALPESFLQKFSDVQLRPYSKRSNTHHQICLASTRRRWREKGFIFSPSNLAFFEKLINSMVYFNFYQKSL